MRTSHLTILKMQFAGIDGKENGGKVAAQSPAE